MAISEVELKKACYTLAKVCLGIKETETVLILIDDDSQEVGQVLDHSMREYAREVFLLKMKPRQRHGEEPPALVAEAMSLAEVVLAPTSRSITHTEARRQACRRGARVASMPGIDLDMLVRTMGADYVSIKELTERLSSILSQASRVEVRTDKGTDITFSVSGRKAIADTGMLQQRGSFGNLPAGEAYIAPVEGTGEGTIVFDGMIAGVGVLRNPVRVFIAGGRVKNIEGGVEAETLKSLLASVGDQLAYNLAEFGIGTNDRATITGKILEDEKVIGTVHFAFGDNASMGGQVRVPLHIDGVIKNPTVKVDKTLIMQQGKLVL
ncbi:aminopeptidase [Moorellaceae bacterium AZ2]